MVRRLSSSLIRRGARSEKDAPLSDPAFGGSSQNALGQDGFSKYSGSEEVSASNGLGDDEPFDPYHRGMRLRDDLDEMQSAYSSNANSVAGVGYGNFGDGAHGAPTASYDEASKAPIIDFLQKATFFLITATTSLAVAGVFIFFAFKMGEIFGQRQFSVLGAPNAATSAPIGLSERAIDEWSAHFDLDYVVERKAKALSVTFDASENIFLGKYENNALGRKREAALHYYLAAALGNVSARILFEELNLTDEDRGRMREDFISLHELNGEEGHFRLGQYYLGNDAFAIARRMSKQLDFKKPNDFIGEADYFQAYESFQIASVCGSGTAYEWRAEVARFYRMSEETRSALNSRANQKLKTLEKQVKGDRDAYCKGEHLQKAYEGLATGRSAVFGGAFSEQGDFDAEFDETICEEADLDHNTAMLCDYMSDYREGDDGAEFDEGGQGSRYRRMAVPTFHQLVDDIHETANRRSRRQSRRTSRDPAVVRGPNGGAASQYYRNSPAAAASGNIQTRTQDGLPDDCVQLGAGGVCKKRESALACNDRAAYHFKKGEAQMAIGNASAARRRFLRASSVGRVCGSEYAVLAAKRLAALNLTCEYTEQSLARISRGGSNNESGGALIDLKSRQRALQALGHYDGKIDGKYGPQSREAAKKFQREFGFSETGDITPIETVYLVCSAAQNANDVKSMNTLGIMYVAGLGVAQNTDNGVYWLKLAADRGNSDAMYNLALIYGSGTILSSYKLCSVVENVDIADSYLRQAYEMGHPRARVLVDVYGKYGPSERWRRIKEQLEQESDFYNKRLKSVGQGCGPRFPASSPQDEARQEQRAPEGAALAPAGYGKIADQAADQTADTAANIADANIADPKIGDKGDDTITQNAAN